MGSCTSKADPEQSIKIKAPVNNNQTSKKPPQVAPLVMEESPALPRIEDEVISADSVKRGKLLESFIEFPKTPELPIRTEATDETEATLPDENQ